MKAPTKESSWHFKFENTWMYVFYFYPLLANIVEGARSQSKLLYRKSRLGKLVLWSFIIGKGSTSFCFNLLLKASWIHIWRSFKIFFGCRKRYDLCNIDFVFFLVEPNHVLNKCRIAQCYDRLGKKAEAKQYAIEAMKLKAKDSESEEALKECHRIAAWIQFRSSFIYSTQRLRSISHFK